MRKFIGLMVLSLSLIAPCWCSEPVRVIFDTDMGNDVDDALALAMLHAFEVRHESKLLAVTVTKDNRWAAPYIDLVNTFYGRTDIPIGVVKNGKTQEDRPMIQIPSQRVRADGSFVYPHRLVDGRQAPDAVKVLRDVLAAQPDNSVVIVQVGFSTNLARLLATDKELIRRKVKLLSTMAGNPVGGHPEYNVREDIPSARSVFEQWPTPIVISGYEIGSAILYPAASINRDFAYVTDHPVADAYRQYMKMPYDRPTWDLTSVLYGVRPDRNYFSLSEPGAVAIDEKGNLKFTPQPGGNRRYLINNDAQRLRILESMIELASQPPATPCGSR